MIDYNQITDHILVGTCPRDESDVITLKQAGVSAIVNLQSTYDLDALGIRWDLLTSTYDRHQIELAHIPVIDLNPGDMLNCIIKATDCIKDFADNSHKIYVHCTAGRERSPTTTVCYLAWHEKMGMDKALAHMKASRPCNPYLEILPSADRLFHEKTDASTPLTEGRILSRYKRFLADVELKSGEIVTTHCPNTGAMTGCWETGAPVQLSHSDNPKRKLEWTLERVNMGAGWIGVNTNRVNHFIADFIKNSQIPSLTGYTHITREPRYDLPAHGKSRFDLLLQAPTKPDCYVEIKNTTLLAEGEIRFPDAVTQRGKKHLQLLQHAKEQGHRAIILFAVNRPEGRVFTVARDIDPGYYEQLKESIAAGVEAMALRIEHTDTSVNPGSIIPFHSDLSAAGDAA